MVKSLEALSQDFSSKENENLAKSLAQLRDLSSSSNSIGKSKDLLEKSIEDLMSHLIAGDPIAASKNVNDMTVAIQTLTAAC